MDLGPPRPISFQIDSQGREVHRRTARLPGGSDPSDYQLDGYFETSTETQGARLIEVAYRVAPGDRPALVPTVDPDTMVVTETHLDGRGLPRYRDAFPGQATRERATYEYDGAGHLVASTDPSGRTTTYDVDPRGRVQSVTSGQGAEQSVIEFDYDAVGNRTHQRVLELDYATDYDAWNRPIRETLPSGYVTERWFDGNDAVVQEREGEHPFRTWRRDARGLVESFTDAEGASWSYSYDANGALLSETGPPATGGAMRTSYEGLDAEGRPARKVQSWGAQTRVWQFANYDGAGRPRSLTEPEGVTLNLAYNALSQVTSRCVTSLAGLPCEQFTYDGAGALVAQRNRNGDQQTITYDGAGRARQVDGYLPDNDVVEFGYDPAGRNVYQTDLHGNVTASRYDTQGRLAAVHHGPASLKAEALSGALAGGVPIARYQYDAAGRVVSEQDITLAHRAPLDPLRVQHVYAANDQRRFATVYPATDDDPAPYAVAYAYQGSSDDLASQSVVDSLSRTFTWDHEHRLRSETFAGETTSYEYDANGLVRSVLAPRHASTRKARLLEHDAAGRLVSVTEPLSALKTTYTWDDRDRITQANTPDGELSWSYDHADRLLTATAYGKTTTYSNFTGEGDPRTIVDPNGASLHYEFDALRRRTRATYPATVSRPAGADDAPRSLLVASISWQYDLDHLTDVVLTRANSGVETTHFDDFDAFGRPHAVTDRGVDVDYDFDPAGRTLAVAIGADATHYRYDHRGRLDRVTVADTAPATLQYFPDGRLRAVARPDNGTSTTYQYDDTLRVESIDHVRSGASFARVDYDYHTGGNVARRVLNANGIVETFTAVEDSYDDIDRLKAYHVTTAQDGETDNLDAAFTFSGYQRATEQTVKNGLATTRTYHYQGHSLDSIDVRGAGGDYSVDYQYDENGNLLRKSKPGEVTDYAWDSRDMLVQVTRGPPGAQTVLGRYAYDEVGWRNYREDGASRVRSVWGDGHLAQDRDATTNQLLAHYHYAGDPFAVEAGGETRYYHQDALGTTLALSNDAGAPTARYRVGPFGEVKSSSGVDANLGRFVFTGHEFDAGTGLTYARARYYDAEAGGFLSRDPWEGELGTPFSMSKYAYGYHNPYRFIDPTGHAGLDPFEKLLGGAAAELDRDLEKMQARRDQGVADTWFDHVAAGTIGAVRGVITGAESTVGALDYVGDKALTSLGSGAITAEQAREFQGGADRAESAAFRAQDYLSSRSAGEIASDVGAGIANTARGVARGDVRAVADASEAIFSPMLSGGVTSPGVFLSAPARLASAVRATGRITASATRAAARGATWVATESRNGARAFGRALGNAAQQGVESTKDALIGMAFATLGAGGAGSGGGRGIRKAMKRAALAAEETLNENLVSALGDGPEVQGMSVVGARGAGVARLPRHHVFPQEHRAFFEARGMRGDLDIDNFTRELSEGVHQAVHGGGDYRLGRQWQGEWNRQIMTRMREAEEQLGRQLNTQELMKIARRQMKQYGIDGPLIPFRDPK